MRTRVFYKGLILLVCISLFNFRCDDGMVEGDEVAPDISVLFPNEGASFYEDGSIVFQANAFDESKIIRGSATILNSSNGIEEDSYQETSTSQNGVSITTIYSSFDDLSPGNYSIVFEFEDANGNVSDPIIRNVVCLPSDDDGDGNGPS